MGTRLTRGLTVYGTQVVKNHIAHPKPIQYSMSTVTEKRENLKKEKTIHLPDVRTVRGPWPGTEGWSLHSVHSSGPVRSGRAGRRKATEFKLLLVI